MPDRIVVEHPAGNPPGVVPVAYYEADLGREDRPGGPWKPATAASLAKLERSRLFEIASEVGAPVPPDSTNAQIAKAIIDHTKDAASAVAPAKEG